MLKPYLFVDTIPGKGRGVFTRERIPANTVIELSPVIVMEKKRPGISRSDPAA